MPSGTPTALAGGNPQPVGKRRIHTQVVLEHER